MRMKKLVSLAMVCMLAVGMLAGCGSDSESKEKSDKKVLKVGMECAYAPFNWTQETADLADGSKAVKIYGTDFYAYGYDVMMAKYLADKYNGLYIDIDDYANNSIKAKIEAFLRLR